MTNDGGSAIGLAAGAAILKTLYYKLILIAHSNLMVPPFITHVENS